MFSPLLLGVLLQVSEPQRTLQQFADAALRYDLATMRKLTHPQYIEISPVGEVDDREKLINSYDIPEGKRPPTPSEARLEEVIVRYVKKDVAHIICREDLVFARGEKSMTMSLRLTAILTRDNEGWKLYSQHYTPIRAKPKAG